MSKKRKVLLGLGILITALSMRMPITASGALTGIVRADLDLTGAQAGFLTTLVVLVFAVASPFIGGISDRFGMNRVLLVGLAFIVTGQLVRVSGAWQMLFLGTGILALGITAANVLMPPLVRYAFPRAVGLWTSAYLSLMNFANSIAAGLTLPLANRPGWSWRPAMLVWVSFGLVALVIWLLLAKKPMAARRPSTDLAASKQGKGGGSLVKEPIVWAIMAFMGFQSMIFYSYITWMPTLLLDRGLSSEQVGLLVFLFQFFSIPTSFVTPMIAERLPDQRILGMFSGLFYAFGFGVMFLFSQAPMPLLVAVMISMGFGSGTTISIAMLLFNVRTPDVSTAARLSGLAQSAGYLMAGVGPVAIGRAYDSFGDWRWPLAFLTFAALVVALTGYLGGRDRLVASVQGTTDK
ncbi:CynX/NimT family MFS transporter [Peptococcus simiae]|uniref:CynX/NimT family MFS transporter n=1 Tax=Peptococcus simiae TaxID=1643805 RepID=UPI00397EEF27